MSQKITSKFREGTETPEILTVVQLSAYLRISTKTIRAKAKAGELPGKRFGRAWRFRKSEIDATMAQENS